MEVVTGRDLRAFVAAREARRRVRLDALRVTLEAALPDLARVLTDAGAERVLAFGSLISGGLHDGSDIDLAVIGLPPERYFATLAELLARAPVAVDLVELELAPPSLAAHVLATGRDLVPRSERR